MKNDYKISYTDHRNDDQEIRCSSWEDAELIVQYMANLYKKAILLDNYIERIYEQK